jgi:hypothetical protein
MGEEEFSAGEFSAIDKDQILVAEFLGYAYIS